jgi:23S rRNA A1618 N6-methylase RlmF
MSIHAWEYKYNKSYRTECQLWPAKNRANETVIALLADRLQTDEVNIEWFREAIKKAKTLAAINKALAKIEALPIYEPTITIYKEWNRPARRETSNK